MKIFVQYILMLLLGNLWIISGASTLGNSPENWFSYSKVNDGVEWRQEHDLACAQRNGKGMGLLEARPGRLPDEALGGQRAGSGA